MGGRPLPPPSVRPLWRPSRWAAAAWGCRGRRCASGDAGAAHGAPSSGTAEGHCEPAAPLVERRADSLRDRFLRHAQRTQPRLDFWASQPGQRDAVVLRIRERGMFGAAAGKFGVKLKRFTHIDNQQKRRTAFTVGRQGAGAPPGSPGGGLCWALVAFLRASGRKRAERLRSRSAVIRR